MLTLTKDQRIVRIIAATYYPRFDASDVKSFVDVLCRQEAIGTTRAFDVIRILRGKKENFPNGPTIPDALKQTLSENVALTEDELERGFRNPNALEKAVIKTIPDLSQRLEYINKQFPLEKEILPHQPGTVQNAPVPEIIPDQPKSTEDRLISLEAVEDVLLGSLGSHEAVKDIMKKLTSISQAEQRR